MTTTMLSETIASGVEPSMMDAALAYAKQGRYIFPCDENGKEPHATGSVDPITGKAYRLAWGKYATNDPKQIKAWWTSWPSANIGFPAKPNGVIVIDVDSQGMQNWRSILAQYPDIAETWTQNTPGGGCHVIYRAPDVVIGNRDLAPGINVRGVKGDGGYIVLTPSIHPNGKRYHWSYGMKPDEIEIAPLPQCLIDLLTPRCSESKQNHESSSFTLSDDITRAAENVNRLSPQRADDYQRWIEVGMALRELGEPGKALWLYWSAQSPKFDEAVCLEKWDTFKAGSSGDYLTPASLKYWADQDDPSGNAQVSGRRNGQRASAHPDVHRPEASDDATTPAIPELDVSDEREESNLPGIQTNARQLRDVAADAMRALAKTGQIFVRGGELVRVKVDERQRASIGILNESSLRGMLERSANFYVRRPQPKTGVVDTITPPPLDVVRDILALGTWNFQPIEGVIESPSMRPDGSILSAPGYDPATRLFYQPAPGFEMPEIPDNPTAKHVEASLSLLHEVLRDFPFADACTDYANALASILTIVARPLIDGPVPIAIYDSPQQSTGKTLQASVSVLLATGESPDLSPAPSTPEEWRKGITARLEAGRAVVLFDNVTGVLEDGSLAAATTARIWSDRILGQSKQISLPVRSTWMVTGNNVRVGGDLVTRCYPIRIDAKTSRPYERDNFAHPNIEEWVMTDRGPLVGAALTLCRAWVLAGRPAPDCPKMRFSKWRNVIGGILEHAGVAGFLGNLNKFYQSADTEGPTWEAFIGKLHDVFGDSETTPGAIYSKFASSETLSTVVPDRLAELLAAPDDTKAKAKFSQRLAYAFRERKGKRYGDSQARIEESGDGTSKRWRFMLDEHNYD